MRNIPLQIVIEDNLSLELAKKVIQNTKNNYVVDRVWPDITRKKSTRGSGYIQVKVNAFNNAARHTPFLILTDLDQHECAPSFVEELLKREKEDNLFFRVAVREVESWILADRDNFAKYISISPALISTNPDTLEDPKNYLFTLAKQSRKRRIREGIPPEDKTARIGKEYNPLLITFVRDHWDFKEAMKRSDSLRRFVVQFDNIN